MARRLGDVKQPPYGWVDAICDFLGEASLRNAFTKGTEQEVEFLVDELALEPGMRVLDVGCGPGRHALALARRGITVHGIDRAAAFLAIARDAAREEDVPASFEQRDVRGLSFSEEFNAEVRLGPGGVGMRGGARE